MKTFLMILAFFAAAQAQANLSAFTGKFKGAGGDCKDWPRVYISIQPALGSKGSLSLAIQYYSDEAKMDEVLLGSGKRQALGTDPRYHGEVTEEWNTQVGANLLVSTVNTSRPSIGLRMQKKVVMSAQGTQLAITQTMMFADGRSSTESCVLQRN